jgi:polysaccharide biosynthesis protein PelA
MSNWPEDGSIARRVRRPVTFLRKHLFPDTAATRAKSGRLTRRKALALLLSSLTPRLSQNGYAREPRSGNAIHLTWVVYYGQTADEQLLSTYDIVILDPGFLGSIELVKANGAQIYGYVSMGEVSTASPSFGRLSPHVILEPNLDWPNVQRVDVRDLAWRNYILDEVIPSIVNSGFHGLMLDTLDTPIWLEQVDNQRFEGMRQAAINLVAAIRTRYPALKLIMNRGYSILPDVIDYLDAIIAESLLTMPDATKTGTLAVEPQHVKAQLELLTTAKNRSHPLPILSLDYSMPDDRKAIESLYKRELDLGHHPYVTTPLIDQIIQTPPRQEPALLRP